MHGWTLRDALELYNVERWGAGYFGINERGHVEVRPDRDRSRATDLHASLEPFFRAHAPWTVGLVKLECGPVVMAHLFVPEPAGGAAVTVELQRDTAGRLVMVARSPRRKLTKDKHAQALLGKK